MATDVNILKIWCLKNKTHRFGIWYMTNIFTGLVGSPRKISRQSDVTNDSGYNDVSGEHADLIQSCTSLNGKVLKPTNLLRST